MCVRVLALVFAGVSLFVSSAAQADVRTALVQALLRPVPSRALFVGAEGRTLLGRMTRDVDLLRPAEAELWHSQVDDLVRNLEAAAGPASLEELYVRLLQVETRGAGLADDALGQIVREELALREPGFFQSLFRPSTVQAFEFAPLGQGASVRAAFLSGSSRVAVATGSAWERSIQTLRELAETPDVPYLLFRTDEGRAIFRHVMGPGTHLYDDPVRQLVAALELRTTDREFAIELAHRVSVAMERYAAFRVPRSGNLRNAALKRVARDVLGSRTVGDGSFEFVH